MLAGTGKQVGGLGSQYRNPQTGSRIPDYFQTSYPAENREYGHSTPIGSGKSMDQHSGVALLKNSVVARVVSHVRNRFMFSRRRLRMARWRDHHRIAAPFWAGLRPGQAGQDLSVADRVPLPLVGGFKRSALTCG